MDYYCNRLKKSCVIIILVTISLSINKVEHHFVCLKTICISFTMNCPLISFGHFPVGLFIPVLI